MQRVILIFPVGRLPASVGGTGSWYGYLFSRAAENGYHHRAVVFYCKLAATEYIKAGA